MAKRKGAAKRTAGIVEQVREMMRETLAGCERRMMHTAMSMLNKYEQCRRSNTVNAWIEDSCPSCKARNLFDNGDPQDMTAMDIEVVKCGKCGHLWRLDQDNDGLDDGPEELSHDAVGITPFEL